MLASTIQISNNNPTPPRTHPHSGQADAAGSARWHRPSTDTGTGRSEARQTTPAEPDDRGHPGLNRESLAGGV